MARKRKTSGRTPRRTLWFRTLIAVAVCGAAVGGLAAYRTLSDGTTERPVTTEEASRLALSRLNLYQASPVEVSLTATEGGGVVVRVEGVVDYRSRRGVGSYQVTGASGAAGSAEAGGSSAERLDRGLIVWDTGGLGLAPARKGDKSPPWQQAERLPRSAWSPRSYTTDPLDAGLQLLIGLGADRPDNPLLLAQSGARRLGSDRIDGRDYDRFAGPRAQGTTPKAGSAGERSPLTYWVDGDGGLRKVTMRMPGLGTPTTLEFSGHDSRAKLPEAPWLTG
ncbi:hypothetical protein [Streptomyces palmae]|uniref:Uncharacterized protein n=1 Tax=Streptomyces palmae TaxID=1701085 RepID=A0A4Z0HG93_9ACTN|nr:hypothetical protein [Streptomyces palmae]TGB18973.1 hypothetical protein E4099_01175 [Streptomyces palmae]